MYQPTFPLDLEMSTPSVVPHVNTASSSVFCTSILEGLNVAIDFYNDGVESVATLISYTCWNVMTTRSLLEEAEASIYEFISLMAIVNSKEQGITYKDAIRKIVAPLIENQTLYN